MGLFKRFFHNDETVAERREDADEKLLFEQDEQNQKKIGHNVLDHCEQIIETAKELEDEKKEYKIVTDYLTDIEVIGELPDAEQELIKEAAEQVAKLNQARDTYLNTSKKISDVQFLMIEQLEEEVPDLIRKLQTNETYQTTVKRDMSYLDGEKLQWTLRRSQLREELERLRIGAVGVFTVFCLGMILLVVLQLGFDIQVSLAWMIWVFLCTLCGFLIFVRYQSDVSEIKRCETNANHAISLLNKVKIKYVNVTNAVDYACEKYHVKNAKEFEYQWEQYQEAVREKEKYMRTNDDLEYYSKKLVRLLRAHRLYDPKVWIDQPQALYNAKEMSEIKHNLLVQRQKLRDQIAYNMKIIQNERALVERLMKLHPEYEKEIREIIESVDRLMSENK